MPWASRVRQWAVVLYPVALPIGGALAEAALIVGVLAWIVASLLARRRFELPQSPLTIALIVWFVLALCSMTNSVDLAASAKGLQKLAKYFALYLLLVATVDEERILRRVLFSCAIGVLVVTVDGLWQAVSGKDLLYGNPIALTLQGTVKRVQAMFHHPSELTIHLASFGPILVTLALRSDRRWRPLWLLASMLLVVVTVLSRSRAGLLAVLIGFVLLAWWLRHWLPVVLVLVGAGLAALTVPAAVKAWAATMPSLWDQLTQPDRPVYWQAALNMITAHPFMGVGINTFVKAYPQYRAPGAPFTDLGPYAHNQYLHLGAEMGWLGLAVLVCVLWQLALAVRRGLADRAARSLVAAASAALGAGLAGYLFIGCFESSLFHHRGSVTFWFLAALIMAVDRLHPRSSYRAAPS